MLDSGDNTRLREWQLEHLSLTWCVRGRPWQVTAISHHLKRARDRAGLPEDVVAYLCRHSWITRALVNGVAPATVAALAGNSIEMVSQVYSHLADEQDHLADAAKQAARQPARQKIG